MRTLVSNAIREHRLIRLQYDGKSRTVEPYVLGKTERGDDAMLCRQIVPWAPGGQKWMVFEFRKIYGLLVLETTFEPAAEQPPVELLAPQQQAA